MRGSLKCLREIPGDGVRLDSDRPSEPASTVVRLGKVEQYVREHLHPLAGPYLFVGSGVSPRYVGLGDWKGLLSRFADLTDQPFEYYRGAAGDDYPTIASMIADAFYDTWWSDPAFKDSVDAWRDSVSARDSPLKYEVALYTRQAVDGLTIPTGLEAEFELLRDAVVDGMITTTMTGCWKRPFRTSGRSSVRTNSCSPTRKASPRSTTSTAVNGVQTPSY